MTIEDFGVRVASVWQGLRPSTRNLVERALLAPQVQPAAPKATTARAGYDARSEWELSRLLAALDERESESKGADALSAEQASELVRMADTCAGVLHNEARSAEVFAQLLERALRSRDYARVDAVADAIAVRLAPSETCELARHPNPSVRAIAHEALLQTPTAVLVALLGDPVDAETARDALEDQAEEYGSEEARWIVNALNHADSSQEDI
ncbi:MAG TPA: hypothetical protein VM934_03110 [Pyrinomonadaceae bacterium]|jgi:hypothetical protein|nr:hypothetical protein [Pyrinomonadaceae bacterium]